MTQDGAGEADTFRCGAAARWLPRTLGAAVLVAALLVALWIDPADRVRGSRAFRLGLILTAAVTALWIVRRGGELRLELALTDRALVFGAGSRQARLPLAEIDSLGYEAPFAATRTWLPATVLIDRGGRSWRLPALLDGGERLVERLLERCDREDLRSWAEALRIVPRMARAAPRVRIGYAVALAVLSLGIAFLLH